MRGHIFKNNDKLLGLCIHVGLHNESHVTNISVNQSTKSLSVWQLVCCGVFTRPQASCQTLSWSQWTSWKTTSPTCPRKNSRSSRVMCTSSRSTGLMGGRSTLWTTSHTSLASWVWMFHCLLLYYYYRLLHHYITSLLSLTPSWPLCAFRSSVMDSLWVIREACRLWVWVCSPTCVWSTTTAGPTAPSSSTTASTCLSCCCCCCCDRVWLYEWTTLLLLLVWRHSCLRTLQPISLLRNIFHWLIFPLSLLLLE